MLECNHNVNIMFTKRKHFVNVCLSAVLVTTLAATALAGPTGDQSGYYRDSQRGWWWGERTVEEEQKPKEEKKQEPKPQEPWIPPALSTYKYEDIWKLHPDQFIELQEAYKKKAVQDPTYENTKDYYELSEIARKKSAAFTNSSMYVWQKHPELTVEKDYPTNNPGNSTRIAMTDEERIGKLRSNKDKYAMIMFTKQGCKYCEDQKRILKWFENKSNWSVRFVDVDQYPAIAAEEGVSMTPTIIMIQKGNKKSFPVSAGVITAMDLEEKAFRSIMALNEEVTPEEFSTYNYQRGGGFDVNGRKDWVPTAPAKKKSR